MSIPTEIPSRQTVTFVVHNMDTTDRYVATAGARCSAMAMEHETSQGWEQLALGFQSPSEECVCPCGLDYVCGTKVYQKVAAGAQVTLVWDARAC